MDLIAGTKWKSISDFGEEKKNEVFKEQVGKSTEKNKYQTCMTSKSLMCKI